jgi:hypothetical protein
MTVAKWIATDQSAHVTKAIPLEPAANVYETVKKGA